MSVLTTPPSTNRHDPSTAGVVLVPGWSFAPAMWQPVHSGWPARQVCLLDWHELGSWLLDGGAMTRGIERALACRTWVGWSLGASLMHAAIARGVIRPERALALSATPRFLAETDWPGVSRGQWQDLQRRVERAPDRALARFDRWLGLPDGQERVQDQEKLLAGLRWLGEIDSRAIVSNQGRAAIETTITWMTGENDPLAPSGWASLPAFDANVVEVVAQAGHGLPLIQPELPRARIESIVPGLVRDDADPFN